MNITLRFWVSFCKVGIWNHIFSNLVHFHLLWEWVVKTVTHQKKELLISHIYTQHTTTPPKTSHPAAWRQLGGRGQLCSGGQLGGGGSSVAAATAAWLWRAAWQHWWQHGSAVVAAWRQRAAWRRQQQLGSSAAAAMATAAQLWRAAWRHWWQHGRAVAAAWWRWAAWQRQRQLGGSVAVAAAVAARRRGGQLGGGGMAYDMPSMHLYTHLSSLLAKMLKRKPVSGNIYLPTLVPTFCGAGRNCCGAANPPHREEFHFIFWHPFSFLLSRSLILQTYNQRKGNSWEPYKLRLVLSTILTHQSGVDIHTTTHAYGTCMLFFSSFRKE